MQGADFTGSMQRVRQLPGIYVKGALHMRVLINFVVAGGTICPASLKADIARVNTVFDALDNDTEFRIRAAIPVSDVDESNVAGASLASVVFAPAPVAASKPGPTHGDARKVLAAARMAASTLAVAPIAARSAPVYQSAFARLYDYSQLPPLDPLRHRRGQRLEGSDQVHTALWPDDPRELTAIHKGRLVELFDGLSVERKKQLNVARVNELFFRPEGKQPTKAAGAKAKARPQARIVGALRLMSWHMNELRGPVDEDGDDDGAVASEELGDAED
jgi:hypothetical protein